MRDFAFKVNMVAVVRVRAADEIVARKVVPTVVKAPGAEETGLANANNATNLSGRTGPRIWAMRRTSEGQELHFGSARSRGKNEREMGRSGNPSNGW